MKSVLISIRPKWCEKIANGQKTVEVRKTKPNLNTPFKVYIYCTKDKHGWFDFGKKERLDGKVIGEFVCDLVRDARDCFIGPSCLTTEEWLKYTDGYKRQIWCWHITDVKIYDEPKPLSVFYKECAGLNNTGMCWDCEKANGEECDCVVNGRLYFTRPPQSWCYVEELEDVK